METNTTTIDPNDTEYEEHVLTDVTPATDGGWSLDFGGMGIYCPANPVKPTVGSAVRLYGRGFGYSVRGIAIDGVVYRYETAEQEAASFKRQQAERHAKQRRDYVEQKPKNDARIAKLPKVFRDRIEKFRAANEDFGPEFEGYELFVCEQAYEFAKVAIVHAGAGGSVGDPEWRTAADAWLVAWARKDWNDQRAEMPGMDDGHSGNTFGAAVALARLYLRDESDVPRMHGALAPLVGSKAYEAPSRQSPRQATGGQEL